MGRDPERRQRHIRRHQYLRAAKGPMDAPPLHLQSRRLRRIEGRAPASGERREPASLPEVFEPARLGEDQLLGDVRHPVTDALEVVGDEHQSSGSRRQAPIGSHLVDVQ